MNNLIEIRVPDIGDFSDVPVVEIPVSVGEQLAVDDTVIVVESDKATLDVPTTHAGRVAEIKVAVGDSVSKNSLVLILDVEAETAATSEVPHAQAEAPAQAAPTVPAAEASKRQPAPLAVASDALQVVTAPGHLIYASPSIRRYARTLGVSVGRVKGTGPKGRILREDIEAFVKAAMSAPAHTSAAGGQMMIGLPEWPKVDFAKFGEVERVQLSRIAKISGPALARNSMVIPHVTNFDKADITELESFRKMLNGEAEQGDGKITMLVFTVKAVVAALKAYPKFNSSLDDGELVLKKYWNIGVAADTPEGLVVPVIKEADKKGIRGIAAEMAALALAAREGKLKATDMQGATFTISSLGGIGGTNFTPIINAPEVAILGMTRAEMQPVWDGAGFAPRLVQPISLSWDHRVVDGVAAAHFLQHVSRSLSDFRRISV